jgi:hypothetical protein
MMCFRALRHYPSSYLEGPQITSIGMANRLAGSRIRGFKNTKYTYLIVKYNNYNIYNGYYSSTNSFVT